MKKSSLDVRTSMKTNKPNWNLMCTLSQYCQPIKCHCPGYNQDYAGDGNNTDDNADDHSAHQALTLVTEI